MGGSCTTLNFGAGPAKLPPEVLLNVQYELLNYQLTGMSVMEISHRSPEFLQINSEANAHVRELLNVPDNYKVLFMQGGGNGCFAAIAMNLMNRTGNADYVVTGTWSEKAAKEAEKYGKVNYIFPNSKLTVSDVSTWKFNPDASYVYYCDNETVDGVEFKFIPETNGVPLVTDMSSSIMTKEFDVSKFGLIFAGAQKNIGPAGVTVVIIREDLLGKPMKICPSIMDFTHIVKENSIPNTPATFSVYVMNKVFDWIKTKGGVKEMEKLSYLKSNLLYDAMKESNGFYVCPVEEDCRSRMNVPFRVGGVCGDDVLEKRFLEEAEKVKMMQLKGHRSVGGIRASLYNAITLDDTRMLVTFMKEFQKAAQPNI